MAAVLSNEGGYYSAFAYLSECRRLRLAIILPDINESEYHYTGCDGTVRIGLMLIDGLTLAGAEALLRERREHGPFTGLDDFLRRMKIGRADGERLIRSGCFDGLEGREKRPSLLWKLLHHVTRCEQDSLLFAESVDLPSPPPYDEAMLLRQEEDSLGMLVSRHPLTLYRRGLLRHKPIRASEMQRHAGRNVTMTGWWISTKTIQDKHGRPMEFISFEDTTALYDATFFPGVYERFCRRLSQRRPYLLKGVVVEEFGVATLRVNWVGFLDGPSAAR